MTDQTTETEPLFKSLLNKGIHKQFAEALYSAYNGTDVVAFIEGLEQIAQMFALKEPPKQLETPPCVDPWLSIATIMYQDMTNNNTDGQTAFSAAISLFSKDRDLQNAITQAVSIRWGIIEDREKKKALKKHHQTKEYLAALTALNYSFRMNLCNDKIEVSGEPISDPLAAKIRTQMRDAGFRRTTEMEDAYWAEAYRNQYHPVREYLNSLSWDGREYIAELSTYFQDKYNMFPTWLRKWMIGACAKIFEAEQNPMLVLDGPQGIGKSEFVKWLAKPLIDYFVEAPIVTADKDTEVRLISNWVWEVSELGATTRKADYEALKAFLTTRKVTVRVPYGRHDISKPAMASFIGTINNSSGIFNDPTGSRRFLVSHLTHINWDYSTDLDSNHLWAEAMYAYLGKEKWTLDKAQNQAAQSINENYDTVDPVEDLLLKHFQLDKDHDDWWLATSDILAVLQDPNRGNLHGQSRGNAMSLAAAMTKLGHEKKRRTNHLNQQVWGYTGILQPLTTP